MSKSRKAMCGLLLITVLFSIQYIFLRMLPTGVMIGEFQFITNLMGLLTLLLYSRYKNHKLDLNKINITLGMLLGMQVFGMNAFLILGAVELDPLVASSLVSIYYVFIIPMLVILKRKLSFRLASAIIIAVISVILVVSSNSTGFKPFSILFIVLSDIFFAFNFITLDRYALKSDGISLSVIQLITSAILSLISWVIQVIFEGQAPDFTYSRMFFVAVVFFGVFIRSSRTVIQLDCQRVLPPVTASAILSSGIFATFIFEPILCRIFNLQYTCPTVYQIAAIALFLCALVMTDAVIMRKFGYRDIDDYSRAGAYSEILSSKRQTSVAREVANAVLGLVIITLIFTSAVSIYAITKVQNSTQKSSYSFGQNTAEKSKIALKENLEDQLWDVLQDKTVYASVILEGYMDDAYYLANYVSDIYKNKDAYSPIEVSDPTKDMAYHNSLYKILANKNISYTGAVKDEAELLANIKNMFYPIKTTDPEFLDLYIGTETGVLMSYDDHAQIVLDASDNDRYYEFRDSEWYKSGKEKGTVGFTTSYNDKFGRGIVITCYAPLYDENGDFRGCIGIDILTSIIYKQLIEDNVADRMEAYIITLEGSLLASKNNLGEDAYDAEERVLSSNGFLRSLTDHLNEDKKAVYLVSGRDGYEDDYYIGVSQIEHTDWILCLEAPMSSYIQAANDIRKELSDITDTVALEFQGAIHNVIASCLILFAVLLIFTTFAAGVETTRMVRPIQRLERDVLRFAKGEFNHRTTVDTDDEIGDLAESFNKMASSLRQYMVNIKKAAVKEERIATELSMARKIQYDLLPNVFPAFPERKDFDVFATMHPAKEVGGDFYDFFLVDDNHLAMIIADVSDKGVPAALFMAVTKTLLKAHAFVERSPEKVFEYVNKVLCENNRDDMFITCWMGLLDLKTGEVEAVNAGHEYPALRLPGEDFKLYKDQHGMPLGCLADVKYKKYEFVMEPGSTIYLYTDGVAEATNMDKELYGTERLLKALNKNPDDMPESILSTVRDDIAAFVEEAPQFDDITMLSVKFNGSLKQEIGD